MKPARVVHLTRRFVGSLSPASPRAEDEAWAQAHLSEREWALWRRLSPADRRHSLAVARRVKRALGGEATTAVVAAALLHDIGKLASGLGTWGRVVATVAGSGTERQRARRWAEGTGPARRLGLYLRHAPIGADMLAEAGSDNITVTWTREHHLPESRWTLPSRLARALADADDD